MAVATIAVILEPPKIKSVTVSIVSPPICHEMMELDARIFRMLSFKPAFSLSSFCFHQKALWFFTFCHKIGVICISEVIDISPSNLDSSLCFIQPGIFHRDKVIQWYGRHWKHWCLWGFRLTSAIILSNQDISRDAQSLYSNSNVIGTVTKTNAAISPHLPTYSRNSNLHLFKVYMHYYISTSILAQPWLFWSFGISHYNQSSIFKSKSTCVHISRKLKARHQFPTVYT